MFIMANDGGKPEDSDEFALRRILCQRVFFFELLSRGVAVTLFKGAEYRDSKVRSHFFWVRTRCLRTLLDLVFRSRTKSKLPSAGTVRQ